MIISALTAPTPTSTDSHQRRCGLAFAVNCKLQSAGDYWENEVNFTTTSRMHGEHLHTNSTSLLTKESFHGYGRCNVSHLPPVQLEYGDAGVNPLSYSRKVVTERQLARGVVHVR